MHKLGSFTVLILILLSLAACSQNHVSQSVLTHEQRQYLPFPAPTWLWDIPEGDNAIGIAWDDKMWTVGAEETAREFAAVSLSRCKGSFVVNKSLIMSLAEQREYDWNKVDFDLVVSADTSYLFYAAKELKTLARHRIHGYLITLNGFGDIQANEDIQPMSLMDAPEWCNRDIFVEGDNVVAIGSSHQADLMDAWYLAQESALQKIGKYRLQNVLSVVRATDDALQKSIAIETVVRNQSTQIDKAFIVYLKNNETPSYKVFLRLKAGK